MSRQVNGNRKQPLEINRKCFFVYAWSALKSRRIAITLDRVSVTANLLESKAPRTCEAVWRALPIEAEAMHCTMSGDCIWFAHERLPKVTPENQSPYVSQGDVVLTIDPQSQQPEMLIVHGRRCLLQTSTGLDVANHFAIIWDPTELNRFDPVAENLMRVGARKIGLEREEH